MKKILSFINNKTKLYLFIDNNKLIYAKLENNNLIYKVNSKEKELIKEVLLSLFPSNNIKELNKINYNNTYINHLYDFNNKFHIFLENNKITNNCLDLNYLFNNQEIYIEKIIKNNYVKRSESRYIKRNVKIKNKVISVLVLSSFLLTLSIGTYHISNINNKNNNIIEDSLSINNNLTVEDIINCIKNNKYLNYYQDIFLSQSSIKFYQDNLEYFDKDIVISNLNKIYIEFLDNNREGVLGDFTNVGDDLGRIRIYLDKNDELFKSTLTHEFLHAFTNYLQDYNYIYEGINVLFNNEYFGVDNTLYDKSYGVLKNKIYILCELIDEDILRKYHANNNINYLIDELVKIIPDYDMALNLFNDLDFICRVSALKNRDIEKYNSLLNEYNLKEKEINNYLKEYYETKYNTSIYENDYIYFLFNNRVACSKIASELNLDFNTFLLADSETKVLQYKKIFNKDNNNSNNLILSICCESRLVLKKYTLESLLNGDNNHLYKSVDDIDLEYRDGYYYEYVYEPISYINYEVKSYDNKLSK